MSVIMDEPREAGKRRIAENDDPGPTGAEPPSDEQLVRSRWSVRGPATSDGGNYWRTSGLTV